MEESRALGLTVGVIHNDRSHVFGYGELAKGSRVRPAGDTIFEVGSVGKLFTGLLLADMVNHGLVRLDQPVKELLPDAVKVPANGNRSITLLDLVTHSSALPRLPDNLKPKNPANPYADYTVEDLYEFLSRSSITRDPGTEYEYSNLGMGLLGHALALRAGLTYERLVQQRICDPLELKETAITFGDQHRTRFARGYRASGYPNPYWQNPTLAGAGAHRSSVNDLLRYLQANIDPTGTPLEAAVRASQVPRFERPKSPRVALAWHFRQFGSRFALWHNGRTGGFRAFAAFDPQYRTAVVALANKADADTDTLGWQILQLLSSPIAGVM
jgi:serine-type D-Ala-D-Ala carboxypeptidase/endopeptidase